MPAAPPQRRHGRHVAIALGLFLLTALLYLGTIGHDFVSLDDHLYVTGNAHVRQGLGWSGLAWSLTTRHASNWHPVTWWSHMADYELFGEHPAGHHATSVLLHALNAALLYLAWTLATRTTWPAALVAALFALHPLRVESVAWVSERKDVLSGLFFMLTLLAYVRYTRKPGAARYVAVLLVLAVGLASKPMLVTLPALLLLLDAWPLARWRAVGFRRVVAEKLPMILLAAGAGLATWMAQASGRAMGAIETLSLGSRVVNAAIAYVAYVGKNLWPAGLACFYPHPALVAPERSTQRVVVALLALAGLAGVSWLIARGAKRRPYLAVGWSWYLGMLLPVCGLVQVGSQALADRYAYLPSIGLYVMVASSLAEALARRPRARVPTTIALTAALALLATATWNQSRYWRDSRALFERALAVTTDNYLAHTQLGYELVSAGELAEARLQFERALVVMPGYARAHQGLGGVLSAQGDAAGAVLQYERALAARPDDAVAHANLGTVLKRAGSIDEAIRHFETAIRLRSDYAPAHNNLGNIHFERGDYDRAARCYEAAVRADPAHARARNNLGLAHEVRGDPASAAASYRDALRIDPRHPGTRANLCRVLTRHGDPSEAREVCEQR